MKFPVKALYYGDNLDWLRKFDGESVDLVYLDPPFNSNADYNVIFREHKVGAEPVSSSAQTKAFTDTWHWGPDDEQALDELLTINGELADFLNHTVGRLGKNDLSAYLVMMGTRLVELHRVLKPTGSLYLHCDPTASHYLKLVLDIIFGPENFRNEIIWKRTTAHSDTKLRFPNVTDTILFFAKSSAARFKPTFVPHNKEYTQRFNMDDDDGRGTYQTYDMTAPDGGGMATINKTTGKPNGWYEWMGFPSPPRGWRYKPETMQKLHDEGRIWYPKKLDGSFDFGRRPRLKRYLAEQEGSIITNLWDDIFPINSQAKERLGYPTQKPLALLERIISASSNPGDLVLDPFCGCGPAVVAAEKLKRHWVGIDITYLSIDLMQNRLERDFGLKPDRDYIVEGTPTVPAEAEALFKKDPFQFQLWAVSLAGAQPYQGGKKGGDTGIDGLLYLRTPGGEKIERVIVSVKGGRSLNPAMLRDLKGVVEREKAAMGILLTLAEPTRGIREEEAKSGTYKYGSGHFPKLQVFTVEELMNGKRPNVPLGSQNVSLETKQVKSGRLGPLWEDGE